MTFPPLLITIDGPAGAGKTTVSKLLADRLSYDYIDTGALYRGIAFQVKKQGVKPDNDEQIRELCSSLQFSFQKDPTGQKLYINQEDVSREIRRPGIAELASILSTREFVRNFLLKVQRNFGGQKRAVFEGRDMGTVVFPDADMKFFLNADLDVRAKRRFLELDASAGLTVYEVRDEISKRDNRDKNRPLSPLKSAPDAIQIDSTNLSAETVVDVMLHHIENLCSKID